MKLDSRATCEGFGRRLLAGLVDSLLALVVATMVLLLGLAGEESPPLSSTLVSEAPGFWMQAVWMQAVWVLAVVIAAQAVFWSSLGATPGMLLLGSQVLNAKSGRKLSLLRSLVRGLGLWLGLACLGVGVVWSIWDPRHQGLHDKLAGSLVVREDESLMTLDELVEAVK